MGTLAKINGIAVASIAKVNGIAKASIASYMGHTFPVEAPSSLFEETFGSVTKDSLTTSGTIANTDESGWTIYEGAANRGFEYPTGGAGSLYATAGGSCRIRCDGTTFANATCPNLLFDNMQINQYTAEVFSIQIAKSTTSTLHELRLWREEGTNYARLYSSGEDDVTGAWAEDTAFDIEFVVNFTAHTYDVWIGGTERWTGVAFASGTDTTLDRMTIGWGGTCPTGGVLAQFPTIKGYAP